MSETLPEFVDAWRMVSARCSFAGTLPVVTMPRLCGALADTDGAVQFELDFGRDSLGTDYVDVRVQAALTLLCQRTLEPFVLPVVVNTRLGLIKTESDEAGLPPECEALLVSETGQLHPTDVIEDELLLALPLVPVNPDSRLPAAMADYLVDGEATGEQRDGNPFAVLRELKQ